MGNILAEGILLNGDYMSLFRRIEDLKSVKLADVNAMAKKYFVTEQSSVLHLIPEKKKNAKQ